MIRLGDDTHPGAYSLREIVVPVGRRGPMHVHAKEEELWFVISGQLTFHIDGETIVADPGSTMLSLRGTPHSLENAGPETARFLEVFSPPGLEGYFEERAQLRESSPGSDYAGLDAAAHSELARRYGLTFLENA